MLESVLGILVIIGVGLALAVVIFVLLEVLIHRKEN